MSKERAQRRAEREAALAVARAARAREVARRARRRALLAALRRPFGGRAGRRRPDSALRRARARQDGALMAGLVSLNGVLWAFESSWLLRGAAAVTTLLAWPLLVVLVFDRDR